MGDSQERLRALIDATDVIPCAVADRYQDDTDCWITSIRPTTAHSVEDTLAEVWGWMDDDRDIHRAALIVAALNALPDLLNEVERLTKELGVATRMIQRNATTIASQLRADLDALTEERTPMSEDRS